MDTGISFASIEPDPPERFVALRRTLGVTTMGINQIVLQPGQRGRIHAHRAQEEVFLVLEGVLTLLVDDTPHDVPQGGLVRVAPEVRRQLVNLGPGRLVLLALGSAQPHEGRDGVAFRDWSDTDGAAPQDTPLPEDLPADRLRTG
ncbi:MAG: cupin domain-containing protein [Thermoleophilia bacterium]